VIKFESEKIIMKNCLKAPIPEIREASKLLDASISAHKLGNHKLAEDLIISADLPEIREWTESIWGMGGIYSQLKQKLGEPSVFDREKRDPIRMPNKSGEKALLERDGYNCRFCGIPVIRKEVREKFKLLYPNALKWESKNINQHAAFQAMWVQFDHLIPHARGGKTTLDNMVITCGPCNYGRMNFLIEEVGLILPEMNSTKDENWDGLERIMNL
jgi:hypothetical protein